MEPRGQAAPAWTGMDRAARREFVEAARDVTPYVAVESEGTFFVLPTGDKAGRDRFVKPVRTRWKERRHLTRALEALDRLGVPAARTTFVDVGAHIGTTAVGAVRWFGFGAAVAIEPEPENLRLLRTNVAVNDLQGIVRIVDSAVADRTGTEELVVRRGFGTKHRLAGPSDGHKPTVSVSVTSLDALARSGTLEPEGVGMLWLDVEGHELEVLRGARSVLEHAPPIVMEFAHRHLRKGRLESLEELLAKRYTHVLDLREPVEETPAVRPLSAMAAIAKRRKRGFTDLLVLRAPA